VTAAAADAEMPGFEASVTAVHRMLDEVIDSGVPSETVVLGGFSQGGALSMAARQVHVSSHCGMSECECNICGMLMPMRVCMFACECVCICATYSCARGVCAACAIPKLRRAPLADRPSRVGRGLCTFLPMCWLAVHGVRLHPGSLSYPRPLGGCVVFSGWTAFREQYPGRIHAANAKLPMLVYHGTRDGVVLPECADVTEAVVTAAGCVVAPSPSPSFRSPPTVAPTRQWLQCLLHYALHHPTPPPPPPPPPLTHHEGCLAKAVGACEKTRSTTPFAHDRGATATPTKPMCGSLVGLRASATCVPCECVAPPPPTLTPCAHQPACYRAPAEDGPRNGRPCAAAGPASLPVCAAASGGVAHAVTCALLPATPRWPQLRRSAQAPVLMLVLLPISVPAPVSASSGAMV
jgi:hypothetical protein